MKASTLKRLADIGQAVDRASLQPLVLVAMAKFDPVDRDAYWDGDDAVLTRYGARDGAESSPGTVHTLVISLHPESLQEWLTTRDMDDDDLEAYEQRHIHQQERRKRDAREERERAALEAVRDAGRVRYDYSGYPINDGRVF